jgi:hypothetical protein
MPGRSAEGHDRTDSRLLLPVGRTDTVRRRPSLEATTMRFLASLGLVSALFACTHPPRRDFAGEPATVTFHVLGLQKTPSGAT